MRSRNVASTLKAAGVGAAAGSIGAALTWAAVAAGFGPVSAVASVGITVGCVVGALHYWKTQRALISARNAAAARQAWKRIEYGIGETQGLA